MIQRNHALTKFNGCCKYKQNPTNSVGCRGVTGTAPKHQSVGIFIKFQKCCRILENEHRDPMVKRVHTPTKEMAV